MKKFSEKVGCSLRVDLDFSSQCKSCVYTSETPVQFETNWDAIVEDF